jgi:polyisoprenoid-binding protein YceI
MKKVFLFTIVAFLATTLNSFTFTGGDTFTANTVTSKVEWVGSKAGGYHPGYLSLKSGSVTVENGKLTGGKFVIDINSLKVTDNAGAKLEGHLKSPDFFDAAKFPEASFEITKVTYTSVTTVEIEGNLTAKGITAPLKFPGYVRSADDKGFFAQAFFSVDAKLLGLNSKYTSSDIQLSIHLFASK